MIPRRAAAVIAEELTRTELERDRAAGRDDDEEDDDLYVEPARIPGEERGGGRAEYNHASLRTSASVRDIADAAFADLNRNTSSAERLLGRLVVVPTVGTVGRIDATKRPKTAADAMMAKFLVSPSPQQQLATDDGELDSVLDLAREAARTTGQVVVEETVRFGGEKVTVSRFVDKSSAEAASAAAASSSGSNNKNAKNSSQPRSSGLDAMIEGISRKRGITTVEKSSHDWQAFKREKHLDDELKDAAKTGFVNKEAFLARVDDRTFELERAAREHERMKRDLLAAQAKQ